jgi:mRNA interferase MazF
MVKKRDPLHVPDRGDLVWSSLDPQAGHEPSGRRPALVLSPKAYNQRVGMALMCPITNQVKGYPFEVALPKGCGASGVVLSDQVKNLDWRERRTSRLGVVSADVMAEVLAKLGTLLS